MIQFLQKAVAVCESGTCTECRYLRQQTHATMQICDFAVSHLLVFHGGDFLKEVRDSLALRDEKVHALEERDYFLTRPMED